MNGGFSSWSHWSHCSEKCGQGMKHRRRYCNNPKPANGGQTCKGSHKQAKPCYGRRCQGTDQWDCTLYMKNLHEITRGEKCFFSSPPTWQPRHTYKPAIGVVVSNHTPILGMLDSFPVYPFLPFGFSNENYYRLIKVWSLDRTYVRPSLFRESISFVH